MPLITPRMKAAVGRIMYRGARPIIVGSTGRSGSTMLVDSITRGFLSHRFGVRDGGRAQKTLAKVTAGYVERIRDIPERGFVISKTHDLFHETHAALGTYVFVFGDPLAAAQSVERVVDREGHSWFRRHQRNLRGSGDYEQLYLHDVLNYEGQLRAWVIDGGEDVFAVHLDDLWRRVGELSAYLGFPVALPERRPRPRLPLPTNYDESLFEHLRSVMREAIDVAARRTGVK